MSDAISLRSSLLSPRQQLSAFKALPPSLSRVPVWTWFWLTIIAVGGSALYGASLSLALPAWQPGAGALWLALSAGLAWCLFGPALTLWTRQHILLLAHACLVTMAYGEGVLLTGAALNILLAVSGWYTAVSPALFNVAVVAVSNVVMAIVLARQLQAVQVPPWKTLLAWMVVLNGSGALFFWLFGQLLCCSP